MELARSLSRVVIRIEAALLGLGYRAAALGYLALVLSVVLWFVITGKVIAPDVQDVELGLPASQTSSIQNRKFDDYYLNYVPELAEHLTSPRSGWLATWSDLNELGQPLYHTEGLSPAYLPTWLLTRLSSDPIVVITALTLLTAFLGGAFAFLLAMEWGLHPLAALSAALLLVSTPMVAYWATFPMYFAVYCWGTGLMWSFQRATRRRDAGGWLALAFCAYALLMSVYPQMIVQHAYLFAAWAGVVLWRAARDRGGRRAAGLAGFGVSAVVVGAALTLPVFLDLWLTAKASARLDVPASFYTALFPNIASWRDAAKWLVTTAVPDLFGNPSAPSYPFFYPGRSVVPWVWLLAISGIPLCLRKTWGWWLAVAVCVVLVLDKSLYQFAVAHFGFGLSRSNPLAVAVLPTIWMAAHALDGMLRLGERPDASGRTTQGEARSAQFAVLATALGLLACAYALALATGHSISWARVLLLGASLLACAALWGRYPAIAALTGVALAVFAYGWPLVLVQDWSSIRKTSPLVEAIRSNLPKGSRYAWVSKPTTLPPNVNATVGLATIHTYDSLSPRRYQALIAELGGAVTVYGRYNSWISPPAGSAALQLSDIGLFLSSRQLPETYGSPLAVVSGVFLYRNDLRIGGWLAMPLEEAAVNGEDYRVMQPAQTTRLPAQRVLDMGDEMEFTVVGSRPTLLVLSQKYNRQWLAEWRSTGPWRRAAAVCVNGFFQGVVVPQGATSIRLSFRPWSRYAWFSHAFFAAALALLVFRSLRTRLERRTSR